MDRRYDVVSFVNGFGFSFVTTGYHENKTAHAIAYQHANQTHENQTTYYVINSEKMETVLRSVNRVDTLVTEQAVKRVAVVAYPGIVVTKRG
jgi:hypothetical protein